MPVVRDSGSGTYALRDGPTWTEADEEHDVTPDVAERLCESDRFEIVDDDSAETCQTVQTNGDVCGRELPCPYHGGDS